MNHYPCHAGGVSAYVVDGIGAKRVRPILDAAIERFQQFTTSPAS